MSYLKRIGKVYHYRRKVPKEFLGLLGLTEIRRSLRTTNLDYAKALSSKLNADVEEALFASRMGMSPIEAFRKLIHAQEVPLVLNLPENDQRCSAHFEKFRQEMVAIGKWNVKTEFENAGCFRRFVSLSGDHPIEEVTHSMLMEYREKLCSLQRENRDGAEHGVGVRVQNRGLSHARINRHLTVLTAFFKWLFQNEMIDRNPALNLLLPKRKIRPDEERQRYAPSEIQLILVGIKRFRETKPERYWIPKIAVFSGMRLNEICQLYIEDIHQIEEVWCFDVNCRRDKELKNPSSQRIVPIHPELLSDGFLGFANAMFTQGNARLFPALTRHRKNGYAHQLGQWFQLFNRKEITEDPRKTFHSLRHAFADILKQQLVEPHIISELLGHSTGSIAITRYGKRFNVKVLFDAVQKIQIEDA